MRTLLEFERPLVTFLFELAVLPFPQSTMVRTMADGGMGSLAFAPFDPSRRYGSTAAECHFTDADKILVLAALFLDQHGAPLEVDVWKVDFSPLAQWPSRRDLYAGSPDDGDPPNSGYLTK